MVVETLEDLEELHPAVANGLKARFPGWPDHKLPPKTAEENLRATYELQLYKQAFTRAWQAAGLDALVGPAMAVPAPLAGEVDFVVASYTLLFNFLGYPAGVVPETLVRENECIYDKPEAAQTPEQRAWFARQLSGAAGMPVGVQVAALPFKDETVLRVMQVLETKDMKQRVPKE